jgi:hypothetical protein
MGRLAGGAAAEEPCGRWREDPEAGDDGPSCHWQSRRWPSRYADRLFMRGPLLCVRAYGPVPQAAISPTPREGELGVDQEAPGGLKVYLQDFRTRRRAKRSEPLLVASNSNTGDDDNDDNDQ